MKEQTRRLSTYCIGQNKWFVCVERNCFSGQTELEFMVTKLLLIFIMQMTT